MSIETVSDHLFLTAHGIDCGCEVFDQETDTAADIDAYTTDLPDPLWILKFLLGVGGLLFIELGYFAIRWLVKP